MINCLPKERAAKVTDTLSVISIQSVNADQSCAAITEYLGKQLGIKTEFVDNVSWQEREAMLDTGVAQVGWVCGLPYTWKADDNPRAFELVAAPVMAASRYVQTPVYFSDVVVRRDSRYRTFTDLRGARWAFNEPHSQSGHNITRYHLAKLGAFKNFFGDVIEAGAHLTALEMLLTGKIDASAIDSTVLELAVVDAPEIMQQLRVIEVLGPSPIPPWIVSTTLPLELRNAVRCAFLNMHTTTEGREILAASQMTKFAAVTDADYDIIREMESVARDVVW